MVPCPIDIVNNAIDDHLAKRLTELCGSENKLVVGSSEYKRIIEMNLGIACLYVDVPDCEIIIWSQMNPVRTLLGFPTGDMTIVLLYEAPVGIAIFSFDGDYLNDPAKVLIFSLLMLLKIWLSSMTNSRSSNRLLCFFYMTFGGRLGDVLILGGRERGGGEFDQRKQLCNLFLQMVGRIRSPPTACTCHACLSEQICSYPYPLHIRERWMVVCTPIWINRAYYVALTIPLWSSTEMDYFFQVLFHGLLFAIPLLGAPDTASIDDTTHHLRMLRFLTQAQR
ncbi:uncharacterized protein [Triticum aestivum]|uniref:uncharacterized protein isoform X2 n=1 Tax=Triticum aestivum TaxID=4565 RepID=UPI001D0233E0|nr:uncharacterized protein LOC123105250 isoform X2 [Triticum aestivum]